MSEATVPMEPVCSTSNCDNKPTHNSGGQLVCGTCLHGMMVMPEPRLMDATARADARQLVTKWCANEMPAGWSLLKPGCIYLAADLCFAVTVTGDRVRIGRETAKVEAVEAALASVTGGAAPGLVWALQAALDDGDCLRGVIARAIVASNSIEDSDAEDVVQEMLAVLLEPEPEGHDDRVEWARMEGANAMLEVIQRAGYGARGIADNRDGLRRTVAELAVAATMPRKPEPEFEAALLQREVEQLRAQLADQQAAANKRVDELTAEWGGRLGQAERELKQVEHERDDLLRAAASMGADMPGMEAEYEAMGSSGHLARAAATLMVTAVRLHRPPLAVGINIQVNVDGRILEVTGHWADASTASQFVQMAARWSAEIDQLRTKLAATQAELSTALHVLDHVAPRPWAANLEDPHDEQDSGEFDDGEWVIADASEREIDRSSAGSRWADGVTNGSWARGYVADVNALGATLEPLDEAIAAMVIE